MLGPAGVAVAAQAEAAAGDLAGQVQDGGVVVQDAVGGGGQDDPVQLEGELVGVLAGGEFVLGDGGGGEAAEQVDEPGLEAGDGFFDRAGAASAGATTSSAKIRPASWTVASCSSCLEPKCAYRPLLLMPIAAARFPIDSPSSPSTVASDAAARKIAPRVRCPSARGRREARAGQVSVWFMVLTK